MSDGFVCYQSHGNGVVKNSQICCDGVTVIGGPNGCGKSTVLKDAAVGTPLSFQYRPQFAPLWPYFFHANRKRSKGRKSKSLQGVLNEFEKTLGGRFVFSFENRGVYFTSNKNGETTHVGDEFSAGLLALGWLQLHCEHKCWESPAGNVVTIDSPETFLSPLLTVEYARLLLLINFATGTRSWSRLIVAIFSPRYVALRNVGTNSTASGFTSGKKTKQTVGFSLKNNLETTLVPKTITCFSSRLATRLTRSRFIRETFTNGIAL
ncbi:MAG: ATP-binding protein [Thermoguttaceae bacterium]|nr:ATP-binding protein [Thermoguttaceae bacterium]